MSDYYTVVWESVKGNSLDNRKFAIIDVTENSRCEIAKIISVIGEMNPKIIGLDVTTTYTEENFTDTLWVAAIRSISNIVLPVEYCKNSQGEDVFLYSTFKEQFDGKRFGIVSFPNNRDILRTFRPIFHQGALTYDSFSCAIADEIGVDISSVLKKNKVLINYTTLNLSDDDDIPGSDFLYLDSLKQSFLHSEIAGKIVLIGSTHLTNDQHTTPLGYNLSGLMIHAHIINSLIEERSITTIPTVLRFIICFFVAFLTLMWYYTHKSPVICTDTIGKQIIVSSIPFVASLIVFSIAGTWVFCKFNYYVDFSPYIVTFILLYFLKDKKIKSK